MERHGDGSKYLRLIKIRKRGYKLIQNQMRAAKLLKREHLEAYVSENYGLFVFISWCGPDALK
jgi:hypothetical protein